MRWSLSRNPFNRAAFARQNRQVRIEPLESRRMMALTLVADLNTSKLPAEVEFLKADGDHLYFSLETAELGKELWTSDGTPEGLRLVKDLAPGANGSHPIPLFAHHGLMYFVANADGRTQALYRTDGTLEGTMFLANASNDDFAIHGDEIYFTANGGLDESGLWRTDGTPAGTYRVEAGRIAWVETVGDNIFYTGYQLSNGRELWRYDTATGESNYVRDVFPGVESGFLDGFDPGFTSVDGKLYFAATNGMNGRELWVSDGTFSGTHMAVDFNPGPAHGMKYELIVEIQGLQDQLLVIANDGVNGREVWRVDRTTYAAEMVGDFFANTSDESLASALQLLGEFDGTALLSVPGGNTGPRLWTYSADTGLRRWQGANWDYAGGMPVITPSGLYYVRMDDVGRSLMHSSVRDEVPQALAYGLSIRALTPAAEGVFFRTNLVQDGPSRLWKSDGTLPGTAPITEELFGRTAGSSPGNFQLVGDSLFFTAQDNDGARKLWRLAPNASAPTFVELQSALGPVTFQRFMAADERGGVFFFGRTESMIRGGLWWMDESGGQVTLVSSSLVSFRTGTWIAGTIGNSILFFESNDGVFEFRSFDAGLPGSTLLHRLGAGQQAYLPGVAVEHAGAIYFGMQSQNGSQLWRSDGTVEGTSLVRDFPFATLRSLAVGNGRLYANLFDNGSRSRIWLIDEFGGADVPVSELAAFPDLISGPSGVYFQMRDSEHGNELWFADENGARLVRDVLPGDQSSSIRAFQAMGDWMYFLIDAGPQQTGLWRTQGTPSSTSLVKAGVRGTLDEWNGMLHFLHATEENGTEAWVSDGTSAGTHLLVDLWPGSASGRSSVVAAARGALFLVGDTASYGNELWKLTLEPGDTNFDNVVDLRDLNNVRNHFGESGLGDSNGDGVVDLADLNAVRNRIGDLTPPDGLRAARDALFAVMATGDEIAPRKRVGRAVAK